MKQSGTYQSVGIAISNGLNSKIISDYLISQQHKTSEPEYP